MILPPAAHGQREADSDTEEVGGNDVSIRFEPAAKLEVEEDGGFRL